MIVSMCSCTRANLRQPISSAPEVIRTHTQAKSIRYSVFGWQNNDTALPFYLSSASSHALFMFDCGPGQNKKSMRLQLIMSAVCQQWYLHWSLNERFCIHLSLKRWKTNEKIESERWIYKYSVQRRTGAKWEWRLGSKYMCRICFAFTLHSLTTCRIYSNGCDLFLITIFTAANKPAQCKRDCNWRFPYGPFGSTASQTVGRRGCTQGAGWLLTPEFRKSAVPSPCCWQEIPARH